MVEPNSCFLSNICLNIMKCYHNLVLSITIEYRFGGSCLRPNQSFYYLKIKWQIGCHHTQYCGNGQTHTISLYFSLRVDNLRIPIDCQRWASWIVASTLSILKFVVWKYAIRHQPNSSIFCLCSFSALAGVWCMVYNAFFVYTVDDCHTSSKKYR